MQVSVWAPYAHEDFVEAWFGRPTPNGQRFGELHNYDFWRASLDGRLYTVRGYLEDGQGDRPGVVVYDGLPILSIGEGLLFTSRFAETFDDVDEIAVWCRFTGLEGRRLVSAPWESGRLLVRNYISGTDEVTLTAQVPIRQIKNNLAEVIHALLRRLYEKVQLLRFACSPSGPKTPRIADSRFLTNLKAASPWFSISGAERIVTRPSIHI